MPQWFHVRHSVLLKHSSVRRTRDEWFATKRRNMGG
jgi:hypothetical protein